LLSGHSHHPQAPRAWPDVTQGATVARCALFSVRCCVA
jgi:hypothetical protein